jgi:hypothetical protein
MMMMTALIHMVSHTRHTEHGARRTAHGARGARTQAMPRALQLNRAVQVGTALLALTVGSGAFVV